MKKTTVLLALALLPSFAGIVRAEKPAKPAVEKKAGKKPESLHDLMKKIGKDFKVLGKSVGDESKVEDNRKLAQELAALAGKCAELVPSKAKSVPDAEREKFVADFKTEIGKLGEAFKKIDAALEKKDFAAAKAAVAEAGALKKEDHPKFIKKKK